MRICADHVHRNRDSPLHRLVSGILQRHHALDMSTDAPSLSEQHLAKIRTFYDHASGPPNWAARSYRALLAHYYNLLIPESSSVLEIGCGSGELLARLSARRKVGIDL